MLPNRRAGIWTAVTLGTGAFVFAALANLTVGTAPLYGKWEITFPYSGRMLTLVEVVDASGYKDYLLLPDGSRLVAAGKFWAAKGKWASSAAKPNDSGRYEFLDANTFKATNAAGQSLTWKRHNGPLPSPVDAIPSNPDSLNAYAALPYVPAQRP
jgi:hypothetical protein